MQRIVWNIVLGLTVALIAAATTRAVVAQPADLPDHAKLAQAVRDGNYAEAYQGLSRLARDPTTPGKQTAEDLQLAIQCLRELNRVNEIDAFCEQVVDAHPDDWRVLAAVAGSYMQVEHYGFMIAGQFERGPHRGGQGKVVNATARDRVRALQLYDRAMQLAEHEDDKQAPCNMLRQFADALLGDHYARGAWRLQSLTDLSVLPDYDEGWGYDYSAPQGAPVDAAGNPVFYDVPLDWDSAANDGQRWRWVLERMVAWQPERRPEEQSLRAHFLHSQFGVQTISEFGIFLPQSTGENENESGTWELHTLGEDETIARLATGVKRFKLPDDQNFIRLYQRVLENSPPEADAGNQGIYAIERLGYIFENRRQYPRAAEYWKQAIERTSGDRQKNSQQRLDQIVGNWGQIESVATQPAGRGATVEFRFRNAKHVDFVAQQIDVRALLADVKAYLKGNPDKLEWRKLDISNFGYRLVQDNEEKYLGAEAARWSLDLEPRDQHFDKRITVTTPLQQAGAYLLTAKLPDGNTSKIVLWLADTAIVRKPMPDKSLYYVADAVAGKPIPKATVEFFGYAQRHLDGNKFQVDTRNLAASTNESGQAMLPVNDDNSRFQWVVIATTPQGRLAYLGFESVWKADYLEQQYNETRTFVITDRPVYRPGQSVEFKAWIRQAQYDLADQSRFAHQSFQVEIHNPKDEKVYSQTLTTDNYGGLSGTFELPPGATLGQYQLIVVNHGSGMFRVEEYKKPEFEVTVEAPQDPVMLGETIKATVHAKYYFGSPVADARVKYKVLRTPHTEPWYPPAPWDWLYGPGYWWFGQDYAWYPGWRRWGCMRPVPPWFWYSPGPPELVSTGEADIRPDGTFEVTIDTSLAKVLHPDQDQSYHIEAEVVDMSRRTIVGSGDVLVAREPFKVFAWVDRGYYRVGDTVLANFAARRLDGRPIEGKGKLRLLKISYDPQGGDPVETEVRAWDLPTSAEGRAELQIKASEKGRYRLDYQVTDAAGHAIEGGYIFTIIGEGFDGSDFRFNDLEIVQDKREYAPGEKVQLQINTNRVGSTVLFFARPSNGAYLPPQMLNLKGKSTVVELEVTARDMPNFFVEAVTVSDGQVHTEVSEIHVPPAKRVVNVEVVPSADKYEPGQAAKVKLKLTDSAGLPFIGSTVLSIYDKSVEYISGGSNVEDIKAFFWKWQRHHQPFHDNSLSRWSTNQSLPNQVAMRSIGVFGETVADDLATLNDRMESNMQRQFRAGRGAGRQPMSAGVEFSMAQSQISALPAVAKAEVANGRLIEGLSGDTELAQPTIRQEFADTALWVGSLETDSDGLAEVELAMPENLTTWKIQVWAMGHGTRVGQASTDVVTRKNIIVRMQAPRFFVETDEVVLSANVHNYFPDAKQVKVRLEETGGLIRLPDDVEQTVEIPAGGEQRVDWRVKVLKEGEAALRMLALADVESDAVEMKLPVYVHGMLKMDSYTGVLRPDQQRGSFEVVVPSERRAEETRLEVRYSPTLAGAMVDALPYLVDYPYGCTEQTLNRFLPAVVTQKTLIRMGLDLKAIKEKRTNLNAGELGDDAARAKDWLRIQKNPVFDEAELTKIVNANVQRLVEMQLSDGGWGWFSGWGEQSTPHATATVVHGLQIAQANDVAVVPDVLARGVAWLQNYQAEQLRRLANVDKDGKQIDEGKPYKSSADDMDALVYMVLVDAAESSDAMRDYLYRDRTNLAVYGLALYGMALDKQHETDKLAMVMRNIGQFLVEDDENQTAYLNLPGGFWWYWYGSEYETHAYYLKLLVATDPKSPIAPRLVKYLVNNRKHATYWNSTRDTALVIEALADYLQTTGEDKPNMTVEVWVDGQKRKEVAIDAENLFTFDNRFAITGDSLDAGRHTVELRKRGTGPLYWNGYLTNFTLENDIRRAGLELKVERHYYKLTPADKTVEVAGGHGQVVDQRVEKYDRAEIPNLGQVTSGDLVEIELVVESKNDYEYVILEDMKAAGCEPVSLQSGYTGNELGAYVEFRDNRVTLFTRQLARGRHSVSYRMRAEIPGRFSALPTQAYAMYAPELKGNSDEMKLRIEDPGFGREPQLSGVGSQEPADSQSEAATAQ